VHFEKSGAKGVKSRIAMIGRGWASRSALLGLWGAAYLYPFLPQMAKVEPRRETVRKVSEAPSL
jgi:hypothetical protein